MTDQQLIALAAHIRANADQAVVAALAIRNDTELSRLYNLASAFVVWRTTAKPPGRKMGTRPSLGRRTGSMPSSL